MSDDITSRDHHSSGVSRRTVMKGAAWSVPAVVVASAAPAFASSQGIFQLDGKACKLPGNSNDTYKGYAFGITATNPFNVPIVVTVTSLLFNGEDLGFVVIVQTDPNNVAVCSSDGLNTLNIPANTTLENLVVLTQNAAASANGTLTVEYTVTGGPGGDYDATGSVNAAPPINGAACSDFTTEQKTCLASYVI
jgi:hypothetical protein